MGRYYDHEIEPRRAAFSKTWDTSDIEMIDVSDVRTFIGYLTADGKSVSPSTFRETFPFIHGILWQYRQS